MTKDEPNYDEREKAALESLVNPRALSESRIAATLQRARRETSFLRRHSGAAKIAAALMVLTMLSAGFWHWQGVNSDRELNLAKGIEVLIDAEGYPFHTREAALGRVHRVMSKALAKLESAGEMTPLLRERVRNGLARPPQPGLYLGSFDEIMARVGVAPLGEADRAELVRALVAGADAIRALPAVDPKHGKVVQIFEKRFRRSLKAKSQ